MSYIIENIEQIKQRIDEAASRVDRNPEEVKLLLATKTVSAESIKIAIESDELLIGENRAQEIKAKYNDLH